jgi:hypothetical protein
MQWRLAETLMVDPFARGCYQFRRLRSDPFEGHYGLQMLKATSVSSQESHENSQIVALIRSQWYKILLEGLDECLEDWN